MDIDKRTASALEYINQGYIQYGFEELKKTAATNGLAAQFYLAVCYEYGIGVEKDLVEAFKMYRKAAERGLPDAMYHIARFYRNGITVSQNYLRESEWLQRYQRKGGQPILPDMITIYNEGLNHPENFSINPNEPQVAATPKVKTIQKPVKQAIEKNTIVQRKPIIIEKEQNIINHKKSEVDIHIPIGSQKQENTFALIIANENYQEVARVANAHNDGKVFAEYCEKTLGIPQRNIKLLTDATLNNISRQLNWLVQIMEVYQGKASIILYYAGHGIPNESNGAAYLLPVDGYGTDITTGYSLDKLYSELSSKPAKSVMIFLDACFSGTNRDGSMLASARGVAIKVKKNTPKGNIVVLSAAQGDETAYPYQEEGHGLFTYYLLKKLQETKGDITLGELAEYVTTEVRKQSIVVNGKIQTPMATPSYSATNWKSWKLK